MRVQAPSHLTKKTKKKIQPSAVNLQAFHVNASKKFKGFQHKNEVQVLAKMVLKEIAGSLL